jgi:hypothetical protein
MTDANDHVGGNEAAGQRRDQDVLEWAICVPPTLMLHLPTAAGTLKAVRRQLIAISS